MTLIVFQHSEGGHGGRLAATLRGRCLTLDVRRADLHGQDAERGVPASLRGVRGVVMLGGAGFVTDAPTTPWMQAQGAFIKAAHEAGLPVVGICLGAQMIGQVLGGVVDFKATPAVGMHAATLTPAGQTDTMFAGIPSQFPQFFACSQEVKQLPPGATLLASAPGTLHAAFRVGQSTYAFQSHPECTRDMFPELLGGSCSAMDKACVSREQVEAGIDREYPMFERCGMRLMENLADCLFGRPVCSV